MNPSATLCAQNPTILIVDDTPANVAVLADYLEERDFQVVVAQDGEEGLKRAQLVRPDLILLDVMMPGIDGFETCRRLKLAANSKDIPVIFMTALAETNDKVKGFEAGGVDYVTKPFRIEEVSARINTHLALRAMQTQLAAQNLQLQQEAAVRLQAQQDIQNLVQQQQTILDNAGVGIAFLKDRHIVRCNQAFAVMYGYRIDDLIGTSTCGLHASEDIYESCGKDVYAVIGLGQVYSGDARYKRRDGTLFWADVTVTALDRADLSKGAICVMHDIDQRKRAELLRSEQGRVLEMVATGTALEQVLDSLMHLMESQLEGMMASILLLEDDGLHLRHGAAPSLPQAYLQAIDGIGIGPKAGSCGTAGHRREQVIVSDILQDPLWDDYRELAATYGLRSCWSTPIITHQYTLLGTFALYAQEVRTPTLMESQLIEMATRIAGIAIERRNAEDRISHMAHHDALTGLPNRILLEDRLEQAMLYAQRYGRLVTVAFMDLDNFKLINDSLGHNTGDEILKTVADRMKSCMRATDTVVRLGGDEFVIILFDQPDQVEAITSTLQKIRETIAHVIDVGGQKLEVTCSMGLATYPNDGADIDTLLMNADAAMYRAKELGRNNWQFYTAEMNAKAHEKLTLQEGLRNAIAGGEFVLLYQPQVNLQSGQIFGVEALIRWQHPILGMISPARFIPLAEQSGLIVPIGDWVLRTACHQNKAWQDAGMPHITMSVNVSARQFREKSLVSRVAYALQESALEARYLELELTESLIMQDLQQAVATMQELQAMGVRLAIDDFGTGYSSLSALKSFPISRLKIDQSFVRDLPDNENDKAIAMAVISLGHQLNLKVIAEGVETERQLAFLRDNECDEMQGYYFSKPVSADAIAALFNLKMANERVDALH
ncbi:MAG: EAL domain-containing protein [Burkholderiaceae bacterium]